MSYLDVQYQLHVVILRMHSLLTFAKWSAGLKTNILRLPDTRAISAERKMRAILHAPYTGGEQMHTRDRQNSRVRCWRDACEWKPRKRNSESEHVYFTIFSHACRTHCQACLGRLASELQALADLLRSSVFIWRCQWKLNR